MGVGGSQTKEFCSKNSGILTPAVSLSNFDKDGRTDRRKSVDDRIEEKAYVVGASALLHFRLENFAPFPALNKIYGRSVSDLAILRSENIRLRP